MKHYQLAVVIGRFQPLHIGHEELIKNALLHADHVLLLLGSSNESRTFKNPFTFYERRDMIEKTFAKHVYQLSIQPLPDTNNNASWIKSVAKLIQSTSNELDITETCIVVCDKDTLTTDSNDLLRQLPFPVIPVPTYYSISATSVRQSLFDGVSPYNMINLPKPVQTYLVKNWVNVSVNTQKKVEKKLKWFDRSPYCYLVEPLTWIALFFSL